IICVGPVGLVWDDAVRSRAIDRRRPVGLAPLRRRRCGRASSPFPLNAPQCHRLVYRVASVAPDHSTQVLRTEGLAQPALRAGDRQHPRDLKGMTATLALDMQSNVFGWNLDGLATLGARDRYSAEHEAPAVSGRVARPNRRTRLPDPRLHAVI